MPHEADQLLADLDPLSHPERQRLAARRAREFAADGGLPGLLLGLERSGVYGRRLAALAASAGRATGYLAERLTDPDPVVRGYALRAARTQGIPDEAIEAAFTGASCTLRRQLTRVVRHGRRHRLAERLVGRLRAEWGDAEAARLLSACGPAFVGRTLPELAHAAPLAPLAARFPDEVLDHLERVLAKHPETLRLGHWPALADVLGAVVRARPARVLDLLERFGPDLPLRREHLPPLAATDAERTVRLLADPRRGAVGPYTTPPTGGTLRRLVRADPPSLPALGRHWLAAPRCLAALLRALPPGRRDAFLDLVYAGALPREGELSLLLPLFPHARRHAEARRQVAARRAKGRPWARIAPALAHLPTEEARPELRAALARPDADDRCAAWTALFAGAAASGDRAAVQDALGLLPRLRNEQDPVRCAALTALAQVPARLLTREAVPVLDAAVQDAVDARDCSYATRTALQRLVAEVLREHAVTGGAELVEWALRSLRRIAGQTGTVELGRLEHRLRRGQEHAVFETLRPWLDAMADTAEYWLLFTLARSLGRRARGVPELQELLLHALQFGSDGAFVTAAALWLDDPRTRDTRVAEILGLEPSAALLRPVRDVLAERRTDLLDPLLAPVPPYGRFLKRPQRAPLPPTGSARRWTPRQWRAAARLAAAAANDPSLPLHGRAAAVHAAAAIPEYGEAVVRAHLHSTEAALSEAALSEAVLTDTAPTETAPSETVLVEAALAALARTDRPADALGDLLAHAGGDRARVAVYAATRAARFAPPGELAQRLGELLSRTQGSKVTSRKEAVRLAAEHLPPRTAADLLVTAYRVEGQHRDVRAAVVAFATGLLDAEPVWDLLAEAAGQAPPPVRRAVLRAHPAHLPEVHRARYARLVASVAASPDSEVATPALAELPRWAAWAPETADVARRTVTDLANRGSWLEAAGAVRALAASGLPHPLGGAAPGSLLHRTLAELAAATRTDDHDAGSDPDAGDDHDAGVDRDLPARRRLAHLADLPADDRHRPLLAGAADLLAAEPDLTGIRTAALRRLVDPAAGPQALAAALGTLADAHQGRPAAAALTAAALLREHTSGPLPPPGTPDALARTARRDGDTGAAAGLFATALTEVFGDRLGWPQEWRALLRELRRHPSADVRERALAAVVHRE
ncbi:hypothetical protein GCM10018790_65900 [Kitasatospora xanthocidica]|uniref:hypothetical protein n=1 Tax=Kitasatospora xanthocidica TaxID=83382 RepID=UPI00167928E8|nr:hypothetical protein [Kitasatospora xanthocidica]GHF78721.1 hypothetical protein GCM10018790_65900 [Kitasatospora xanthocidica]